MVSPELAAREASQVLLFETNSRTVTVSSFTVVQAVMAGNRRVVVYAVGPGRALPLAPNLAASHWPWMVQRAHP